MIKKNLKGEFKAMAEVQQKRQDELLARPNVQGVALGNKFVGGEDTGEPALLVLVDQKLEKDMLTKDELIPERVDELKTDVLAVGQIFAQPQIAPAAPVATKARAIPTNGYAEVAELERPPAGLFREMEEVAPQVLTQKIRPAVGGFSVGHYKITAGTIATCCYDMTPFPGIPSRYYILSNNHVLANSNVANIGDPILQPGPYDGGTYPADVIGRLSRFVPIRFMTPAATPLNYVDAAIAEVPFHLANREIYWIGYVKGLNLTPQIGDFLQKTGRTTNYTTGRILAINATVDVNYGGGQVARFARQILTTNMSAGGDSGSLVLDLDEKAVGLLFAGSSTVTVINMIAYVQALLNVRIHEKV